jgi:recombination protein RecA
LEPKILIGEQKAKVNWLFFRGLRLSPMRSKAAALRLQVESVLASRLGSPFQYRDRQIVETVPAGIPPIDDLTGGLPRGSLTEVYGPPCSGRTSFLVSALASRTAASEVCALVDARDAFDPHSAERAGVRLNQLVWVRCRNADQALRATDLLIQGGGFGLIALDLSDTPPHAVRSVPLPVWFRFRRAVEYTPTILLVLDQESNAKSCASLVLRLRTEETSWSQTSENAEGIVFPHSPGLLLDGWKSYAEMIRSSAKQQERVPLSMEVYGDSVGFEMQTIWNDSRTMPGPHVSAISEGARRKR